MNGRYFCCCCRVTLFCWLCFIHANVPGSTCSAEKLIMVVFEADEISVWRWKGAYLFSSGSLLFSCQSKYWASTSRFGGTSFLFGFGFFFCFCNVKWSKKKTNKKHLKFSLPLAPALMQRCTKSTIHYLAFLFKGPHIYSLTLICRT